jgi:hypothetical protein
VKEAVNRVLRHATFHDDARHLRASGRINVAYISLVKPNCQNGIKLMQRCMFAPLNRYETVNLLTVSRVRASFHVHD